MHPSIGASDYERLLIDEWTRNLLALRPDLGERLAHTRALMNAHVRNCLVTGFEHMIPSIELPNPDDRHVVAAINSGASLIVTFNLKDFPADTLTRHILFARHPDCFIPDLLDLHSERVCEAVANHRRSLRNPPKTVAEYLDTLLKQGLPPERQGCSAVGKW